MRAALQRHVLVMHPIRVQYNSFSSTLIMEAKFSIIATPPTD